MRIIKFQLPIYTRVSRRHIYLSIYLYVPLLSPEALGKLRSTNPSQLPCPKHSTVPSSCQIWTPAKWIVHDTFLQSSARQVSFKDFPWSPGLAIVSRLNNKSTTCWEAERIAGEAVQVAATSTFYRRMNCRNVGRLGRPHWTRAVFAGPSLWLRLKLHIYQPLGE